jgi:predicted ATP-binding protein involved in virulence
MIKKLLLNDQVIELQPKLNPNLADIHIITGPNGSWKTSMLKEIQYRRMNNCFSYYMKEYNNIGALWYHINNIYIIEDVIKQITGRNSLDCINNVISFNSSSGGVFSLMWIVDFMANLSNTFPSGADITKKKFVLAIDDVECGLSIDWQRRILPVIQKTFPRAQIIITTHSPFIVGSIGDAWIYKLKIKDNKGILDKIIKAELGTSYTAIVGTVFDFRNYFDLQTENDLEVFYQYRDEMLRGNKDNVEKFKELTSMLYKRSLEVRDIVACEIRQYQRITGEDLKL